jgi:CheY-like chemotaxis protein
MTKRTIVLADGSYTIRRIVELSFSEIDDVEVASFENGQGLKEKLLSLKPDVVVADIKLPDLNGYDICRFVNSTEALKKARVYLLKGSFDPIDGEQLKSLRYQDIITKPFDSNQLVSMVMKVFAEQPAPVAEDFEKVVPGTLPEDFAEIESEDQNAVDISFSDIREEIRGGVDSGRMGARSPERDDVQPSEEITQGTQSMKDTLAPEIEESFDNPFAEDAMSNGSKLRVDAPPAVAIPPQMPEIEFGKADPELDESFGVGDKFPEFTNEEDTSEAAKKVALDLANFSEKDEEFPGDITDGSSDPLKPAGAFLQDDLAGESRETATATVIAKADDLFGAPPEKEFVQESHDDYLHHAEPTPSGDEVKPPLEQDIGDFFAPPPAPPEPRPIVEMPADLSLKEKSEMIGVIEDKLTVAVKELLWEIIPPLAEKIIKEEIDKIKSELKSSEG